MISGQSNNSLYNQAKTQNCKDLQTYFNIFRVTIFDNANVSILEDVPFK